jgi:hypothetical protein
VYSCNLVVENGSGSQVTEARFFEAFYYYNIIDLFGQAPYREAGSALTEDPKVWSRAEAGFWWRRSDHRSLPTRAAGDASIANKDAAHFLLAKLYLNKGV